MKAINMSSMTRVTILFPSLQGQTFSTWINLGSRPWWWGYRRGRKSHACTWSKPAVTSTWLTAKVNLFYFMPSIHHTFTRWRWPKSWLRLVSSGLVQLLFVQVNGCFTCSQIWPFCLMKNVLVNNVLLGTYRYYN